MPHISSHLRSNRKISVERETSEISTAHSLTKLSIDVAVEDVIKHTPSTAHHRLNRHEKRSDICTTERERTIDFDHVGIIFTIFRHWIIRKEIIRLIDLINQRIEDVFSEFHFLNLNLLFVTSSDEQKREREREKNARFFSSCSSSHSLTIVC